MEHLAAPRTVCGRCEPEAGAYSVGILHSDGQPRTALPGLTELENRPSETTLTNIHVGATRSYSAPGASS